MTHINHISAETAINENSFVNYLTNYIEKLKFQGLQPDDPHLKIMNSILTNYKQNLKKQELEKEV